MGISQKYPVNKSGQLHVKLLLPALHVPPLIQGTDKHTSKLSHRSPVYSGEHMQLKLLIPSLHVPPFSHGFDMHTGSELVSTIVTTISVNSNALPVSQWSPV